MSNVQIDKDKLDELAMKVYGVSDDPVPMTVDEMIESLDTAAHSRPIGTTHITSNGEYNVKQFENAVVDVPFPAQNPPVISSLTVTPSSSRQVFNNAAYDGYKPVTVNAMPSGELDTLSFGLTSSSPAIAISNSGLITATVNVGGSVNPVATSGYIPSTSSASYSIVGTNTLQMTTRAGGYVYATDSAQVLAESGTYVLGTLRLSALYATNLRASNIKDGTTIIINNGHTDVFSVTGTYTGGGTTKNIQVNSGSASVRTNGYTSTGISLTVAKTGTYKVTWTAWRSSSSGTMGTNLHRNSTTGTNQQTWTNTYGQHITLNNQSYTEGDVLTLYATAGSTSRYCWVAGLTIEEQ